MRRWVGGIVVGALLWGLWVLLWRRADPVVLASGAVFPLGIAGAAALGLLRFDFSLTAWYRLDLWLRFAGLVALLVAQGVTWTGWSVLTGRSRSGIVTVPLEVRSEMGRLLLMWAITVTPGTIALLAEGDLVYIHCLHRPEGFQVRGEGRVQELLRRLWG